MAPLPLAALPKPSETHRTRSASANSSSDGTQNKEMRDDTKNAPAYDPPTRSHAFHKDAWVKADRGAYAGFGTMAMALDLIPGAAVVCMFGNVAGAAMWASRIEKEGAVEGIAYFCRGSMTLHDLLRISNQPFFISHPSCSLRYSLFLLSSLVYPGILSNWYAEDGKILLLTCGRHSEWAHGLKCERLEQSLINILCPWLWS